MLLTNDETAAPSYKASKDCLTLFCSNTAGDCRLCLALIYHAENLSVKGGGVSGAVCPLPVTATKKAWMVVTVSGMVLI